VVSHLQKPNVKACIVFIHFLCQLRLPCYRTYSAILGTCNAWVCDYLVQVVSDCRFCDGADIALVCLEHVWVVGWKDGGGGADYRAERVVHLLGLRLVDIGLEDWALCGRGG
jgi:hypothetical protein